MINDKGECFLCNPDTDLLYLSSTQFQAMLGIGPVVEGYTILSTKNHIRSMFDMPSDQMQEFHDFRRKVLDLLARLYGMVIITEHGRVPMCDFYDLNRESHCYHAHQLLFPINIDLVTDLMPAFPNKVETYRNFNEAQQSCTSLGEYIYYESSNRVCYVVQNVQCPRQYFRILVAEKIGHIERVDWRNWQGWDLIDNAREKIQALLL